MTLRKVGLMSLLALAAVALAAPSMASANWLHDHEPIHENEIIEFHGTAGFGTEESGTTCEVEGAIEATSSTSPEPTTGHLVEFTIEDHEKCTSEGLFNGCEIAEHPTVTNSASNTHIDEDPLPVHIEGHHLTLTDLTIDTKYTHPVVGGCRLQVGPETFIPITGNALHFDEVTLFDKDDGDSTTVNNLSATGDAQITLYDTTLEQEENKPFTTGATIVNTEATTLKITPENTWGWNGTG